MASLPRTGAFFRRTLDCPFTDKGIQAYELKRVHRASGQSAVRRHTRARLGDVVVVVVADGSSFSLSISGISSVFC